MLCHRNPACVCDSRNVRYPSSTYYRNRYNYPCYSRRCSNRYLGYLSFVVIHPLVWTLSILNVRDPLSQTQEQELETQLGRVFASHDGDTHYLPCPPQAWVAQQPN